MRAWWPWARWSLARQLPLTTAAILVLVMSISLTLTYDALVQARSDSLHSRLKGLLGALVQAGETSARVRASALHHFGRDTTLARALSEPAGSLSARDDSAVTTVLEKVAVPTDSGLPIELWTVDGHRVAHIGVDIRGDSIAALPPELRSRQGTRVSEVPSRTAADSAVRVGALYSAGDRVYFWEVAPVLKQGHRVGAIVQQRRIASSPQTRQMIRDLSGEEVTVYLRNSGDEFWSSLDGRPVPRPVRRDTTNLGFFTKRIAGARQIGIEGRVRGTPYLFVLEAPKSAIVAEPRATLRRLAVFSVILLLGGVAATWALSRQITGPLVALTTATEAMAHGEYGRNVDTGTTRSDEVARLGASFNRMASEVEASQHALAAQVEAAVATSQQLDRAKSDCLAVMSHELRTPLNAIGGYTEILQLGIHGPLTDAQQNTLVRIARSQQALLALINDVLNFAKIEAGEVRYSITDVPVATTLHAIEDFLLPQLDDRKITYCLAPIDPAVTVCADADKLQQILINLLSNAVKYTLAGGRIDVRCGVSPDRVHVHVQDTGIGIADDRLDKIFDPFIQVSRALNRPHDGVGLGLSISRDLAEAMGGTLSATSVLGQGSTFTLTLKRGTQRPLPG